MGESTYKKGSKGENVSMLRVGLAYSFLTQNCAVGLEKLGLTVYPSGYPSLLHAC